jgi:putative transposase
MCPARIGALWRLSPAGGAGSRSVGTDAVDRRAVSGDTILRLTADDGGTALGGPSGQPQAGAAADAADGLEALGPQPKTSRPSARHRIYPYLLRGLAIDRPNQVWAADITYIPMARGFLYLVMVMDWYSRYVLAWRLSNTMDTSFCLDALENALRKGRPEIFNTDQGAQFTSMAFTDKLEVVGVRISMDGRGRWLDNVLIERLWRSLKYEEVHLKAYANGLEARIGIGQWVRFYNERRLHQTLGYKTPAAVWAAEGSRVDLPLCLDDAAASPTTPQGQQQQNVINL